MSDKGADKLTKGFVLDTQTLVDTQDVALQQSQNFDTADFTEKESQEVSSGDKTEEIPEVKEAGSRIWLWLLVIFSGLGVVELVLFSVNLYVEKNLLGILWLCTFCLLLILIVISLLKELKGLKQLKTTEQSKHKARLYYANDGVGTAEPFCQKQVAKLPEDCREKWRELELTKRTNRELIQLLERQAISIADVKVLQHISKHASATGVMIAVSPLAMMDMLIILWRSLTLFQQVAACYGMRLGYWARIKLLRKAIKLLVFAGASEVLIETGSHALGASLGAKLSAQLAQGMGAGILISRLGLQAMEQCRPVPWLSLDRPVVGDITRQLLSQIKNMKKS